MTLEQTPNEDKMNAVPNATKVKIPKTTIHLVSLRRRFSKARVAQGFRCSRTYLMLLLPPDAYPPRGVGEWCSTSLKGATQGTALTTDLLSSVQLWTSSLPSSSLSALHVLRACTTSGMHFALAGEHSTRCRTC